MSDQATAEVRRGIGNGPLICMAPHLDKVITLGTDLTVRREATRLLAPGIGTTSRAVLAPV